MKKSGRILLTAELGREYGFRDVGGELIGSFRAWWLGGEGPQVGEVTRLGGGNPPVLINSHMISPPIM